MRNTTSARSHALILPMGMLTFSISVAMAQTPEELRQKCDAGFTEACLEMAGSYEIGRDGFPEDKSKAVELYRKIAELGLKACESGNGFECLIVAGMVQGGIEGAIEQDQAKAAELFRKAGPLLGKACESGDGLGCAGLAEMHWVGVEGVIEKDRAKAADLYRKAAPPLRQLCEGGSSNWACLALKDTERKLARFDKAAEAQRPAPESGTAQTARSDDENRQAAMAQMKATADALVLYRIDTGRYPDSLADLVQRTGETWFGPYLRDAAGAEAKEVPKDPWGDDYIYSVVDEGRDYTLRSKGGGSEIFFK